MAPAVIVPKDGGSIVDPAKNGTARCMCCSARYSWGHPPKSAATWHLYEDDGTPHCRWVACKPHANTARPSAGKQSTLCPNARASAADYFAEFPPKGKRTFRGRKSTSSAPVSAPEPAIQQQGARGHVGELDPAGTTKTLACDGCGAPMTVNASAVAGWCGRPCTPPAPATGKPARRKQRAQRAPVGAPAPTPINPPAAPASDVLDADLAGLEFLVDSGSGVMPAGTGYVAQDGEVEAVMRAIRLGQNVCLIGPPGCGKTQFLEHVAAVMGRELVTVIGDMPVDHITGRRDFVNGQTVWRDGLLPYSMTPDANGKPRILYLDEPNTLPLEIRPNLYSALDHRRMITLPEDGNRVVRAPGGWMAVSSYNAEGFAGTTPLAPPFQQRFDCVIRFEYLGAAREVDLLCSRVPALPKQTAALLVDIAGKLRDAKNVGRKLPRMTAVGTRTLLATAARIADGEDFRTACRLTIGGLTVDATEYKVILDTVDAVAPAVGA